MALEQLIGRSGYRLTGQLPGRIIVPESFRLATQHLPAMSRAGNQLMTHLLGSEIGVVHHRPKWLVTCLSTDQILSREVGRGRARTRNRLEDQAQQPEDADNRCTGPRVRGRAWSARLPVANAPLALPPPAATDLQGLSSLRPSEARRSRSPACIAHTGHRTHLARWNHLHAQCCGRPT